MRSFLSDLGLFLYTIISYWQSYVTGGVVTGAVALFERLSNYRLTKKAYVFVFVFSFLFVAFFFAWRDEHKAVLDAQHQVLVIQDDLRATIQGANEMIEKRGMVAHLGGKLLTPPGIARNKATFKPLVLLTLRIVNSGHDSVVNDYAIEIKTRDGKSGTGKLLPLSPGGAMMTSSTKKTIFPAENDLALRTAEIPIKSGDQASGVLIFEIDGLTLEDLLQDGNKYKLTFRDFDSVLYLIEGEAAGPATPGGDLLYVPGVRVRSIDVPKKGKTGTP